MYVKEVSLKVTLVQAPQKSLIGLAAKFCTDPGTLEEIQAKYSQEELIAVGKRAVDMGHGAVAEFDNYVFAVEGVSRTLTHQLVRKRLASYAQESMRFTSQGGEYQIVIPESVRGKHVRLVLSDGAAVIADLMGFADLANQFYEGLQAQGVPNEDARFGLLEASKTKILVELNSHGILDFCKVRTCTCAQWEIRAMARQMLELAKEHDPIIFENAGPTCLDYGMCREDKRKWKTCKRMPHKDDVIAGIDRPYWSGRA